MILFSGFSEFKLPEARFIALFSEAKTPTLINIDYSPVFGPQIHALPENVRRLVKEGHNQQIKMEISKSNLVSEHIRN
jgi:hypothetical protein